MRKYNTKKPEIPDEIVVKWQRIVDQMAKVISVPAGLIMKVDPPQIEVFLSSATEDNPYEKGERADLNTGLYCETVMKQRRQLLVTDALKDTEWNHNPDIELGMIYYLGFPIEWPDGEIFGTICVLDTKDNPKATSYSELIFEFKEAVETDLHVVLQLSKREQLVERLQDQSNHLQQIVTERTAKLQKAYEDLTITYEELKGSENKFRTLFENANDAIYVTDLNGQFLEVNQVACDQLEYTRSELLHMNPQDIDSIDDVAQVEARINQLLQHGHAFFETVHNRKDGSTIPVEVNIRLIDYMGKKAILGISRDITERKINEFLLVEKAKAEATARAKSEFISTMSHEIRTPLTVIIGYADLLGMQSFGTLNKEQESYVQNILESGTHLLALINDELDLSKIEASKMELYIEEVSIPDIIDDVRTKLMPLTLSKNIDIRTNVNPDIVTIKADKMKFKQILYNFVSNALKFTPEKGTITIKTRPMNNMIQIDVIDTGIGISEENMKELFQPFKQVSNFETREQHGTGLGLTLVKKIVELHGGEVLVESEVGKGSTFGFTMPIDPESISN
ncbi:PAS domain S-box protein [Methanococcoides orientis]|uniref:ATP-binding protein n=1 Tax=Methanococcoides orientis TaxID=2822137 RepID=UPI001E57C51E|nr:ATP-binding protein [Methanococcoides orientis]UGV41433.1 PAS domain S-box protein [Methanococcoides orientis]